MLNDDLYDSNEFESIRKTLLNQYHSQNITHSGFIIAVIIGVLTVISRADIFFKEPLTITLFFALLGSASGFCFYLYGRIRYWNNLINLTLIITEREFLISHSRTRPNCVACIGNLQHYIYDASKAHPKRFPMEPRELAIWSVIVGLITMNALMMGYLI